VSSGIVE